MRYHICIFKKNLSVKKKEQLMPIKDMEKYSQNK